MDNVLLEEATVEQLIEALASQTESIVLSCKQPTNNVDGGTLRILKGPYIEMWGHIKKLEGVMKYRDYMIYKEEYEDNPSIFFDSEDN